MLASRVRARPSQRAKPRIGTGARRSQRPPKALSSESVRAKRRDRELSVSRRPLGLLVIMMVCAGLLVGRLVFWTVMEHGRLAATARAEQTNLAVQTPLRGLILNAQGEPFAMDVTMNLVYAVPTKIKEPVKTAALLAPVLHQSQQHLEALFGVRSNYVQIAPRVGKKISRDVKNLGLPGIFLFPVVQRVYPQGSVASQTLGFANVDNKGNGGLEGYYDNPLSGRAGLRSILRDTAGNNIHLSSGPPSPARNGADLHLSIDRLVQQLTEDELRKAIKKQRADGGSIIVMDPATGYILGMANTPTFDPNHYWKSSTRYLNPSTQLSYEPGSTYKIITMAAGLDSGAITPQSAFDDTGQFVAGDRVLHNWNMSGFGWENMTQVLQHSANVGAAWVAQRLGTQRFYDYVKRFRFGKTTQVDLQGEATGILPLPGDKNWTIVNLFTNAFGQGLTVTPLQMIRAVGAVANGGMMMKPQVVKSMVYDGHVIDRPPVAEGRVISKRTARTLTDMLVHSAIGGEAALGLVPGYNVAAKTGTANIAGPDGGYLQGVTIASIVGYAPAYHPRFVVLVKIDHPRNTPWGSMAAAPVLHDLLQDLFMYYHIPPSTHSIYR